jgi:hypothetical protein
LSATATRDTGVKRTGSASVKIVADAFPASYLQSVNVGDTATYTLVCYVYTNGAAVTTADLDIWYNGAEVTTTFTADTGGWYKLSGTLTGANASRDYGVCVHAGKTVYCDDFQLVGNLSTTLFFLNSGTGGTLNTDTEGSHTAANFVSDAAVGTQPFACTSTTKNDNLNADQLDSLHAGNTTGLIPISNGTVNTNLNSDMLDGKHVGTTGNVVPLLDGANSWSGHQTLSDVNIVLGTTTGTKFGTATTQKLAFYNSTPVDKPDTVADAATQDLTGLDVVDKTKLEADLTSCKNTINALIDRLQELGLIA